MATLFPSPQSVVEFAKALEDRFLNLCELHGRVRGTQLIPPKSLDGDFLRWRELSVRFKRGDFRHAFDEEKAMLTIASWSLDMVCELTPGKVREKMPWEN